MRYGTISVSQPVLVGGRSPRELHAEQIIMERAAHTPHSALGSGLRNLVGILDGAALVLAPDTGPLHMTVALDRPVVSLMGYTNPKRTGPYRKYPRPHRRRVRRARRELSNQHGESRRPHAANFGSRRARSRRTVAHDVSVGGERAKGVAESDARAAGERGDSSASPITAK